MLDLLFNLTTQSHHVDLVSVVLKTHLEPTRCFTVVVVVVERCGVVGWRLRPL